MPEKLHLFQRILSNPTTIIIFSIVWGFGLATMFRKACTGRNCIIYRAPAPEDVQHKTFKVGEKCYQYQPRVVRCDSTTQIVPAEQFKCPDVSMYSQ